MKKHLIVAAGIVLTVVGFFACKKTASDKNEPVIALTETEATDRLYGSEKFADFSLHFVPDFIQLMEYHRTDRIRSDKDNFLRKIKDAKDEESVLTGIYMDYGLDLNAALVIKNKLDNDLLTLINQHPFLLQFDEIQSQRIILQSLDRLFKTNDSKSQELKAAINRVIHTRSMGAFTSDVKGRNAFSAHLADLTIDEVWDCLTDAVGVSAAGLLSIAGIQKLASQGIQAIVVSTSKWLLKRAGWFGAVVMLLDFGNCIYAETRD
ncbi:MAG: hypothetical protein RLZZ28_900 [Bacteroidota bacterium]